MDYLRDLVEERRLILERMHQAGRPVPPELSRPLVTVEARHVSDEDDASRLDEEEVTSQT